MIAATEKKDKKYKDLVLHSRGIDTSVTVLARTTQCDLHTTGPRHFGGGLASDGSVEALVVK